MTHEEEIITEAVASDMRNPRFDLAAARILIVRLSPFEDIQLSYSHLVLFDEARRALPDAYIDFGFLPPPQDRKELVANKIPWFFGRASKKAPSEFTMILISCAYTLELINLPWLLSQSEIPFSRAARMLEPQIPFLILGGSSAVTAGSLLAQEEGTLHNCLVDALFFGEGEGSIGKITKIAAQGLAHNASKPQILQEIAAKVRGFWSCETGTTAARALSENRPDILTNPLILNSAFADRAKLAITAGCVGHCSFCLEGWDRRPFREQSIENITAAALRLKKSTGARDIELFSYNFNMHHEIMEIIPAVGRYFQNVSVMSQRIDIMARNPSLLEAEIAIGKRSFTLGIEGISERLRAYYHKGIIMRQIQEAVSEILQKDARELKLFFIISGFEEENDFQELRAFFEAISQVKMNSRAHTRIIISAGYLVRLPFTPLQFAPLASDRNKLSNLKGRFESLCAQVSFEFRLAARFDEYWADQLLSLAGPSAHEWIIQCPQQNFVYDKQISRSLTDSLEQLLSLRRDYSTILGEKSESYRPCFSFIENDQHWTLLRTQYNRAKRNLESKIASQSHLSIAATDEKARKAIALIVAQENAKARFPSVVARIDQSMINAFSLPEYECSSLIRCISSLVPLSERAIFGSRNLIPNDEWISVLHPQGSMRIGIFGEKYFEFRGPSERALEEILERATHVLREKKKTIHSSNTDDPILRGLVDLELAKKIPSAEYCTLLYTCHSFDREAFEEIISLWLQEQGIAYTIKKKKETTYLISERSKRRKSVQGIQINTYSSNTRFTIKIGKKTNLAYFVEKLHSFSPLRLPCFKIELWEDGNHFSGEGE